MVAAKLSTSGLMKIGESLLPMDDEIKVLLLESWRERDIDNVYRTIKWRLLDWRTLEQAVADGDREKAIGALHAFNEGAFI